jgi:Ca-activated chloride channel homolog
MDTASRKYLAGLLGLLIAAGPAAANTPNDDDEQRALEEVVVTASFNVGVRQGGAQDAGFFRNEVAMARIPNPRTLTFEGLLGDHDIRLRSEARCRQLFCLTAEAMKADLPATPEVHQLVGIGFDSNLSGKAWRREPLNLVAVVDKSGSMSGAPLDLVRRSLSQIAQQLQEGDQLAIVLYGSTSHVHLAPTRASVSTIDRIQAAIDSIRSEGSTSMEAGLTLGYEVARSTAARFNGNTRVMLFTDERPNTDATDADTFMGMAEEASQDGIGLTTIGVGVQFGAELATTIGSVRGGNLYFIADREQVKEVFESKLDFMVSELAHDLKLSVEPAPGWRIAAIYGVPNQLLGWQKTRIATVTIPTVFLSPNGGGIFVSLVPEEGAAQLPPQSVESGAVLANLQVDYVAASPPRFGRAETGHHAIQAVYRDEASHDMRLGHLLVDEFTALRGATSAHYLQNDQEAAYQLMRDFSARLDRVMLKGIAGERRLASNLLLRFAHLSGHGAEVGVVGDALPLWGRWSVVNANGETGLMKDMRIEFLPDGRLRMADAGEEFEPFDARNDEDYDEGDAEVPGTYAATKSKVYLPDFEEGYDYRARGNELSLTSRKGRVNVTLTRLVE